MIQTNGFQDPVLILDSNRQTAVIKNYHCSPNGYQKALDSALKTVKNLMFPDTNMFDFLMRP